MYQSIVNIFEGEARNVCPKHQVLINPDEAPRGVYYVRKGYVKAYDIAGSGEYQLVAIIGPGEYFPLSWAFGNDEQQLFYETMTTIEFSLMPLEKFRQVSDADPNILKAELHNLAISLRALERRIQNHQQRSAPEKVAYQLMYLSTYYGQLKGKLMCIETPLTYQDLADSLNVTRETVNRTMNRFINEGIIVRLNRRFCIADMPRLQAIFDSHVATPALNN